MQGGERSGIGVGNEAVEVEQQDTGRRGVDELLEQQAFFVLLHPLLPQVVDHRVVDVDELVHLALAHRHELEREVLRLDGLSARRDELEGPHEALVELVR